MSKTFEVEVLVPEGLTAGDTFTIEVEAPKPVRKQRGMLAGIALADMDDSQLKREIINAGSVLYKAKQRGAAQETIDANQARLDAAKAEKQRRVPAVEETAPAVAATMETDSNLVLNAGNSDTKNKAENLDAITGEDVYANNAEETEI